MKLITHRRARVRRSRAYACCPPSRLHPTAPCPGLRTQSSDHPTARSRNVRAPLPATRSRAHPARRSRAGEQACRPHDLAPSLPTRERTPATPRSHTPLAGRRLSFAQTRSRSGAPGRPHRNDHVRCAPDRTPLCRAPYVARVHDDRAPPPAHTLRSFERPRSRDAEASSKRTGAPAFAITCDAAERSRVVLRAGFCCSSVHQPLIPTHPRIARAPTRSAAPTRVLQHCPQSSEE